MHHPLEYLNKRFMNHISPVSDAQIYSNMGMAYSSMRQYQEAFKYLKKAQALGLTNPSIERELQWLRNNVGMY